MDDPNKWLNCMDISNRLKENYRTDNPENGIIALLFQLCSNCAYYFSPAIILIKPFLVWNFHFFFLFVSRDVINPVEFFI